MKMSGCERQRPQLLSLIPNNSRRSPRGVEDPMKGAFDKALVVNDGQTEAILKRKLFETPMDGNNGSCGASDGGRRFFKGEPSKTRQSELGVTYEGDQEMIIQELEDTEVRDRKLRNGPRGVQGYPC
ncbi:hypothetical protein VNO80_19475 [Phaseolus coccineus]|uniref:Uncharacterized protein n=1 Tax=Phaseolus coccineus TaxID=3886 RepID=A0AAN9R0P1_PHACN